MRVDLLVIGAGLDGAAAALEAARAGRSVVVSDEGYGTTAMWPGFFDVFGPVLPPRAAQAPNRFARGASAPDGPLLLEPQRRLDRLSALAPDHPYAAHDFDADRVRGAFEARLELLGIPGTLHREPVLVATALGTIRYADFTCEGLGLVDGVRTRFVGLDELPQWSPEWAAKAAEAATGRPHQAAWAATDAPLATTSLRVAAQWDAVDSSRLAYLASAAAGAPCQVPAVLGTTFEARRRAGAALAEAGVDALEVAGGADSAFGLRLTADLRSRIDAVAHRVGSLDAAPVRSGGVWRARSGAAEVEAAELHLAFDAPLPPEWAESWLEPERAWPRNAAASPWQRHHFVRRPVAASLSGGE